MTARLSVVERSLTNGHAKTGGPRHRMEVDRHELVGRICDWQALAEEAVYANAAAWQTTLRLPEGIWRDEMQAAHLEAHTRLKALLSELRLAAGRYDGFTPPIGA